MALCIGLHDFGKGVAQTDWSPVSLDFLLLRNLGQGFDYGTLKQVKYISFPQRAVIKVHNQRSEFRCEFLKDPIPYHIKANYCFPDI